MNEILKPATIVVPAPGCGLRCKNGHVNSWDVRILPAGTRGKVVAVRCTVCGHTIKLDNKSFLEGSGTRSDLVRGTPIHIKPGSEYKGDVGENKN